MCPGWSSSEASTYHYRTTLLTGPETAGNFAAVSTMEPDIEIWDLDTLDVLEPSMILGGVKDSDRAQQPQLEAGGKKKRKLKKGSHKSSVLSLAWNSTVQNVLASGGADKTVKVRP